jgi:hypothetical protein
MNPFFAELPTSIFAHMSGLAARHGAVNLGQGFPDFGWPDDEVDKAAEALRMRRCAVCPCCARRWPIIMRGTKA